MLITLTRGFEGVTLQNDPFTTERDPVDLPMGFSCGKYLLYFCEVGRCHINV